MVIERERSSSQIVASFIATVYELVMKLHMVGGGSAAIFSYIAWNFPNSYIDNSYGERFKVNTRRI